MQGDILKTNPLVSIGVASYNNSKYIIHTLKSILSQSYENIELVIVDDHSTDDSVQKINEFIKQINIPCKFLVNEKNKGVVAVCNQLLDEYKGNYFVLIGSDDVMLKDRVRNQLKVMMSYDADMVFARIAVINENGDLVEHQKNDEIVSQVTTLVKLKYRDFFQKNIIPSPSAIYKTEAVRSLKGYDTRYSIEDQPLWLRLAKNDSKIVYMNEVVVHYRVMPNSLNHKIGTMLAHFLMVKDNIGHFTSSEQKLVRLFWMFRLTGEKEFRDAPKNYDRNLGSFLYWYSIFNRNRLLHFCFYKFLRSKVEKESNRKQYEQILDRPI